MICAGNGHGSHKLGNRPVAAVFFTAQSERYEEPLATIDEQADHPKTHIGDSNDASGAFMTYRAEVRELCSEQVGCAVNGCLYALAANCC